ncbi:MAG: hypothetical protein Q7K40_04965 [bacterium]|nr:hypothetical protein [bacterium]
MDKLKISQEQISHANIDGNINVFQALIKGDLPNETWYRIMVDENIAGNPDLQDKFHDYLMENGEKIETEEQLRLAVSEIKK